MLFWLILGCLLGAGALFLQSRSDIKLAWFDWLLLALAVVFYVLAISNYSDSMSELEPRAALFLLASFGLPGIILTVIVAIRAWRNRQPVVAEVAS
ncbi:dehalogenase [Phototrophicus methaneseepsis]|uniref:Dehalogenase n=1 Tax=Phototrophicus methaneseepsis TaxID=2710758 RepID=A0A7S8IF93_9CHLR|nr:dehalogenase [Phototrophicus methaneseepsis]QPC84480.1 dehalogenase [Phototrophicus methaneseepsis]